MVSLLDASPRKWNRMKHLLGELEVKFRRVKSSPDLGQEESEDPDEKRPATLGVDNCFETYEGSLAMYRLWTKLLAEGLICNAMPKLLNDPLVYDGTNLAFTACVIIRWPLDPAQSRWFLRPTQAHSTLLRIRAEPWNSIHINALNHFLEHEIFPQCQSILNTILNTAHSGWTLDHYSGHYHLSLVEPPWSSSFCLGIPGPIDVACDAVKAAVLGYLRGKALLSSGRRSPAFPLRVLEIRANHISWE
jgi:hypothetical protein